ncbi:Dabb family protein [Botrimarina sp.]|uniref:Dabb family protein n=1 Tax=Botrimarina sp. TaxID=2795802 RepID=UPI0032EECA99
MTLLRTLAVVLFASVAAAAPQAHMVFFTLADPSEENRDMLVAACHEHLSGHEGTIYFSVGEIAAGRDRDVNDQAFHVALHMVFDSPESHDKYQTHPRHLKFIATAKSLFSGVRVFDSDLVPAKEASVSVDQ